MVGATLDRERCPLDELYKCQPSADCAIQNLKRRPILVRKASDLNDPFELAARLVAGLEDSPRLARPQVAPWF